MNKQKLSALSLIFSALPLLLAGYDAVVNANPFGWIYIGAGIIYIAVFFKTKHHKQTWLVYFGSAVLLVVAADMFAQNKKYLPYAYMAAAILNILFSVILKKRSDSRSNP
ncbi:hypothetical protein K1X84_01920 [bacterium]|nr:hypothetical protein [bacterium]